MKRLLTLAFLTLLLALHGACKKEAPLLTVVLDHPTYRAGQVWNYRTRPGEEGSTFTVLAVERHRKLGIIVHVSVSGLRLKGPEGRITNKIDHMPFSEAAITASVLGMVSTGLSPFEGPYGYYLWREAFVEGKAGIFTRSVAEGVSFVEEASQHATPGKA
jgi:hypothetical protein